MITAAELLQASRPFRYSIETRSAATTCPACGEREKVFKRSYCNPCEREMYRDYRLRKKEGK